jgi:nicotinamide riboside kinase
MKIALLGAESTGKSQLAFDLAAHLCASGQPAVAVGEYLREWCEREGRTPQPHEQAHIAHTQQSRIESAAEQAPWVIADTTPLMTAAYSEFIFSDSSLHAAALAYQHSFDLTLLSGLDMPWLPDGIQRDGAHVRGPVDALLRRLLESDSIAFEVIYGQGPKRLKNALQALKRQDSRRSDATQFIAHNAYSIRDTGSKRSKNWQWNCEKCSDPQCEHRLFRSLQLG